MIRKKKSEKFKIQTIFQKKRSCEVRKLFTVILLFHVSSFLLPYQLSGVLHPRSHQELMQTKTHNDRISVSQWVANEASAGLISTPCYNRRPLSCNGFAPRRHARRRDGRSIHFEDLITKSVGTVGRGFNHGTNNWGQPEERENIVCFE